MRVTDLLILRGWCPLDRDHVLWLRRDTEDPVSFWEAAATEGIMIPHFWDANTMACSYCGMTQYRVFVQGESPCCTGVPDAKAFQDSADHSILQDRIKRALGGEEGTIWDKNE